MLAPEIETRPWTEQSVIDDAQYRNQLDYLYGHSAFYQKKFKAAGIGSRPEQGALPTLRNSPSPKKAKSGQAARPKTPSVPTSVWTVPKLCASIRPAAPQARQATFH